MSQQASPPQPAAPPVALPIPAGRTGTRALLGVFTVAVFGSAFLLFLVQPMYTRMVLPLLGGTPAVWNTCILFFQAALLAGYLYAHASARWLGTRAQIALHLALLGVAALALPVTVARVAPQGTEPPVPWLLALMLATVGLPFFALSGTGPLLQRWFSRTGHPDAESPYFLYAASNIGSMVALLGYPVLVEPRFGLSGQSQGWAAGYLVLVAVVAVCALPPWAAARREGEVRETTAPAAPLPVRRRAEWVMLALVPSALLLSVTTFLTTDIAPIPLLWVVPLALYLLSFAIAFSRRPLLPHHWMLRLAPVGIALLVLSLLFGFARIWKVAAPLHLTTFFLIAMVCHGELIRRRPDVRHLTEFYLWIAFGGLLGGVFNVLVAPVVFPRMEEYGLLVVAACLARPWHGDSGRRPRAVDLALLVPFGAGVLLMARPELLGLEGGWERGVPALLLGIAFFGFEQRPLLFAACIAGALGMRMTSEYHRTDFLRVERTFFGRYVVIADSASGLPAHSLHHGSTLHGAQIRTRGMRREPLTYYGRTGPVGQLLAALPPPAGQRRVAAVGLGTGTLAAYGAPGETWTFFEIDPGMERIARDPDLFTYLADSPARTPVVLGDARLSLARAPDAAYDLVVLDAFSSDAIPIHLMTREALGLYLDKLAPGGAVVFHLSNRYLDLEPVVAALAAERGLVARIASQEQVRGPKLSRSTWAVLARRPADLGPLLRDPRWKPLRRDPDVPAWTDDYSSLLQVFGR